MRKRVSFTGFVEIPDVEIELGYVVEFRGKGEVTGDNETMSRKQSGEVTLTETFTCTVDPDTTKIGKILPPQGPLDEELSGE